MTPFRRAAGAQFLGTRFGCLSDKGACVRCVVALTSVAKSESGAENDLRFLGCCIQQPLALRVYNRDRQGFDQAT